ncbi:MAG: SDR family oxidoreductase [Sphingobacterium sp.]|jgi:NAD(P)-dependent dehydrogenase (short-subunit alcohol dehydrogenase family)|nr:SDR family oxidoreductase [Sphingobacterium sp.]
MRNLENKVVLVTGGNSGIGFATAKEFIENGAKVIITGRRRGAVEQAADEIGAIGYVADQASLPDIENLSLEIKSRFGNIDILFINAGITGEGSLIDTASEVNFDAVMDINLKGSYFTLSRFIPLLRYGGSVVILSSNVASLNMPQSSIYQASKAAVNSIARTAAMELAGRKIRVNTVSPGPTRTEVLNKNYDQQTVEDIWNHLAASSPLQKIGTAEDVAKMVVYLSSDAASYITGADFVLDGGMRIKHS